MEKDPAFQFLNQSFRNEGHDHVITRQQQRRRRRQRARARGESAAAAAARGGWCVRFSARCEENKSVSSNPGRGGNIFFGGGGAKAMEHVIK